MTKTIAETRVRAQVQEYDGWHFVYVECWTAREWKRVATFTGLSDVEAYEQAHESGWDWLLSVQ